MSLAKRTVQSIGWNSGANLLRIVILFGRSVLLARLLPVEAFGIFAGATAMKGMTQVLAGFGMPGAFLNRSAFSEDESATAEVHFTLQLIFSAIWVVVMMVVAFIFYDGIARVALIVVVLAAAFNSLATTPRLLLRRRVVHRRTSLVNVVTDIATTIVAVSVALVSPTVWALLATEIAIAAVNIVMFYVWRPVWRPRFNLAPEGVRYFLSYGSRVVGAQWLLRVLDLIDNMWTQVYLGDYALGLYARSYTFATYPRKVVGVPVNTVAGGTYAELKGQREALSQMFFRLNGLLLRSGFFFAGILALVAPEFIRLVLGAKWLPFLDVFRLMLVFTLLDPIKTTIGEMFITTGHPHVVLRARIVQLIVLVAGMFVLGTRLNIVGVALAVNIMLVLGIGILLWEARKLVDFSVVRLFGAPSLALIFAMLAGRSSLGIPGVIGSDWRTGAVKIVFFALVYIALLWAIERRELKELLMRLRRLQDSAE